MNKSKVEFITDLLSNERLKPFHREKLYPLILSEIKQVGDVDEQLWNEIQLIKEMIMKNAPPNEEADEKSIHEPLKTSEKLNLFKDGNKLKRITHIFPDEFNYELDTANAIEEYNAIAKDLPNSLRGIIGLFLKPKASDATQVKFRFLGDYYKTWWSDDIKIWCAQHPLMHPDNEVNLRKNIIEPFKRSIEIRQGEDLITAIEYRLKKTFGNDILEKIKLDLSGVKKSTRFFTGVDQLMSGIASLFSPIIARCKILNTVKISTSISELNDQYVTAVTIQHTGSDDNKEFIENRLLNGDLLNAKEKFTSLCDWIITANFSNGTFVIPILKSVNEMPIIKQDNRVEGFTHQLIFY